jgi:hypothetical protein
MQAFNDFLTFKTFISLDVLIIMYYLGALGVPITIWLLARWLKDKFCTPKEKAESKGSLQTKLIFIFLAIFIAMEIFWRVMFEFLIAYFQMRDVLVGI